MNQIIIGAGISGLALADLLKNQSDSTLIIEKSRGLGGRMATRRDEKNTYDHGAQFYKLGEDLSRVPWHVDWQQQGLTSRWFEKQEQIYWCSKKGMTAFAKILAEGLSIELNEKVIKIECQKNQYVVLADSGKSWTVDRLFLTCPLPQSLDLLDQSNIIYDEKLRSIQYAKAFVGLLQLNGFLDFEYLENVSDSIFSISNQKSKGMSEDLCVSIVMNPDWAEKNFDSADDVVLKLIEKEFLHLYSENVDIQKAQLKKWKYCHPLNLFDKKYYQIPGEQIFLIGDAFGGKSVVGAIHSAIALSQSNLL